MSSRPTLDALLAEIWATEAEQTEAEKRYLAAKKRHAEARAALVIAREQFTQLETAAAR